MTEVQKLAKIKVLKDLYKEYVLLAKYNGGIDYDRYCALEMAIKALEQEPKQGHWIVVDDCGDNLICECSECKDEVWFKDASRMWNYCSSCGARMKGVEE